MNILKSLPRDLQELISEFHDKNLNVYRDLARKTKVTLYKYFFSPNYEFYMKSTIICDANRMCWAKFKMGDWNAWSGWAYNLYNVPIGHVNTQRDIIRTIIPVWKRLFAEFVKFNYNCGQPSFEGCKTHIHQIKSINWDKYFTTHQIVYDRTIVYPTKRVLYKIIKKAWFDDNIAVSVQCNEQLQSCLHKYNQDRYANPPMFYPHLGCFRMDDAIPNIGSNHIRVPYTEEDIEDLEQRLPLIYMQLQKFDMISTPLSPMMKKPLKELLKMFMDGPSGDPRVYNERLEKLIRVELNIRRFIPYIKDGHEYAEFPFEKPHEIISFIG